MKWSRPRFLRSPYAPAKAFPGGSSARAAGSVQGRISSRFGHPARPEQRFPVQVGPLRDSPDLLGKLREPVDRGHDSAAGATACPTAAQIHRFRVPQFRRPFGESEDGTQRAEAKGKPRAQRSERACRGPAECSGCGGREECRAPAASPRRFWVPLPSAAAPSGARVGQAMGPRGSEIPQPKQVTGRPTISGIVPDARAASARRRVPRPPAVASSATLRAWVPSP